MSIEDAKKEATEVQATPSKPKLNVIELLMGSEGATKHVPPGNKLPMGRTLTNQEPGGAN